MPSAVHLAACISIRLSAPRNLCVRICCFYLRFNGLFFFNSTLYHTIVSINQFVKYDFSYLFRIFADTKPKFNKVTFGDGILAHMSRDFGIYMPKHLAGQWVLNSSELSFIYLRNLIYGYRFAIRSSGKCSSIIFTTGFSISAADGSQFLAVYRMTVAEEMIIFTIMNTASSQAQI